MPSAHHPEHWKQVGGGRWLASPLSTCTANLRGWTWQLVTTSLVPSLLRTLAMVAAADCTEVQTGPRDGLVAARDLPRWLWLCALWLLLYAAFLHCPLWWPLATCSPLGLPNMTSPNCTCCNVKYTLDFEDLVEKRNAGCRIIPFYIEPNLRWHFAHLLG